MCSNAEKSRYLKLLVAEIRAEIAKRRVPKAPKPSPGKTGFLALAGLRK